MESCANVRKHTERPRAEGDDWNQIDLAGDKRLPVIVGRVQLE